MTSLLGSWLMRLFGGRSQDEAMARSATDHHARSNLSSKDKSAVLFGRGRENHGTTTASPDLLCSGRQNGPAASASAVQGLVTTTDSAKAGQSEGTLRSIKEYQGSLRTISSSHSTSDKVEQQYPKICSSKVAMVEKYHKLYVESCNPKACLKLHKDDFRPSRLTRRHFQSA